MTNLQTSSAAAQEEASASAVSWGAITAGAFAAFALTLVLLAFGAGMGFSAVSPWANAGVTANTVSISAGIYLLVVAMLASSIGGYIAGRLRTKWVNLHTDEVFFRDTAHGFMTWAVATVLGALLLTSVVTNFAGRAASGLPVAAATAANQSAGPIEPFLDTLFRADPSANRPPVDAGVRSETSRILANALRGGELDPADRTYVAQAVSARTGLSQADAEKRVDDVMTRAKAALDEARSAAAKFSLWLAAAMLVGAFSASLAATEGGQLRDGTWK
jgi:hypothetical protein